MSATFQRIRVYEFHDARSDKLWVIAERTHDGAVVTWFGKAMWNWVSGQEISHLPQGGSPVASGSYVSKVREKERKGYTQLHGVTFDPDLKVLTKTGLVSDEPILPTMIAIDCLVDSSTIKTQVTHSVERLREQFPELLAEFHALPVVQAILRDDIPKSSDYNDGALALTFLVALMRKRLVHLYLDNGAVMPTSFQDWSQLAKEMPTNSQPDLRRLAECLGATEKRIDLRNLQTRVPTAFV